MGYIYHELGLLHVVIAHRAWVEEYFLLTHVDLGAESQAGDLSVLGTNCKGQRR